VAVRRRTASLALTLGAAPDLLARLCADPDSSVRAAAGAGDALPEAPLAEEEGARSAVAPAPAPAPPPGGPQSGGAFGASIGSSAPALTLAPTPLDSLNASALHAVRTAIFGLSETELAEAIGLAPEDTVRLAGELVTAGLLARRGRRLVAGPDAESIPPLS
jgi:hypothetical protein